jgi:hypothetical protein
MKLSGDVGRRTAWGMGSDPGNEYSSHPIFWSHFSSLKVPSAPIFVTDESSASTIANTRRNYYNIFSLPCSSNSCFIPNIRLRSLVAAFEALSDDDSDVRQIELKLRSGMFSVDTWESPPGGSETLVSDPNIQHYLGMIVSHAQARNPGIVLKNGAQQIPARMAGRTKPESRIVSSNGFILIGNEVKGFQHSQYEAMAEGFQIGGDGVLALRLEGNLELGNCAVPVILGFSDSIQIYGVYLLPESVPVFTPLSSPVSYLTFEGRLYLSRWAIALSNFAVSTETLLQNSRRDCPRVQAFSLSRFLFYKPIISQFYFSPQGPGLLTCRRSSLDSMMSLYRDLFLQERATDYILFPLGLLSFLGKISQCTQRVDSS